MNIWISRAHQFKALLIAVLLSSLWSPLAQAQKAYSSEKPFWQGAYVGGSIGVGFSRAGDLDWTPADAATVAFGWGICYGVGSCPQSMSGEHTTSAVAGLQLGYNVMASSWLLGIEADVVGRVGSGESVLAPRLFGANYVSQHYSQTAVWTSTVRGRVGRTLTPGVLVYATGGLAFGEIERSYSSLVYGGGLLSFGSSGHASAIEFGWVAGGGVEWAAFDKVSFGLEYLHMELGSGGSFSSSGHIGLCLAGGCNFKVDTGKYGEDTVRLKVNFKL